MADRFPSRRDTRHDARGAIGRRVPQQIPVEAGNNREFSPDLPVWLRYSPTNQTVDRISRSAEPGISIPIESAEPGMIREVRRPSAATRRPPTNRRLAGARPAQPPDARPQAAASPALGQRLDRPGRDAGCAPAWPCRLRLFGVIEKYGGVGLKATALTW
jgi:hypothetical protein